MSSTPLNPIYAELDALRRDPAQWIAIKEHIADIRACPCQPFGPICYQCQQAESLLVQQRIDPSTVYLGRLPGDEVRS